VTKQLDTTSPRPADTAWTAVLQEAERTTWQIISSIQADIFFEGAILPEITAQMPEDALLFVSSSLPVRHLDQFTRPRSTRLRLFANRGASGIDGTIASALGVGAATDKPLVLVIGDLAFYHDMNSLLALRRCGVKATIVLINNNGGGIFHRLPIAQFDPPFTNYFVTPHDLDFGPIAQTFGVIYHKVTTLDSFQQQFSTALDATDSHIIEFTTDALLHEQVRRSVVEQVRRDVSATLSAK
jgi:2-succinyl-5-enolpyruvyl-6-hydroxy-3-cyclohexene-1-carboxylate synthase